MVRTKRATGAPLFASLAQPRDAGIWHKDPATPCVAVEIQPTVAQILPIYTAWSRFLSGTPLVAPSLPLRSESYQSSMASLEIRLWLTCSSAFLMCVCVGEEQGDDSEEKSKDGEELCSGKNHCLLVRYPRPSTSVNPTRAAAAQPTQAHEGEGPCLFQNCCHSLCTSRSVALLLFLLK